MSVLVLCDHDRGALAEASLEALTFGRQLASELGVACHGVVIGKGSDTASEILPTYGSETVHFL